MNNRQTVHEEVFIKPDEHQSVVPWTIMERDWVRWNRSQKSRREASWNPSWRFPDIFAKWTVLHL